MNEQLKFPKVGFKVQPNIAYDTFGKGLTRDIISENNFVLDSRNGEYYLRQVGLLATYRNQCSKKVQKGGGEE